MKRIIIHENNLTTAQESIPIDKMEDGSFKAVIHYTLDSHRLLKTAEQKEHWTIQRKEITGNSEDDVREQIKAFLDTKFSSATTLTE